MILSMRSLHIAFYIHKPSANFIKGPNMWYTLFQHDLTFSLLYLGLPRSLPVNAVYSWQLTNDILLVIGLLATISVVLLISVK